MFAPTIAYAAAGWADLCTKRDIEILQSTQRKALISVVGAYRTASRDSLCVTAGATPVELLLKESAARYELRHGRNAKIGEIEISADNTFAAKTVQYESRKVWQANWDSSTKGRTTYSFLRNVHNRVAAGWIQPNHWSAQVLTGHGDFRARLASLGLADSSACSCGDGDDTVPHFILHCSKFEAQRVALQHFIGNDSWRWPEVAPLLVETPEAFSLFSDFCSTSLWLKSFDQDPQEE